MPNREPVKPAVIAVIGISGVYDMETLTNIEEKHKLLVGKYL